MIQITDSIAVRDGVTMSIPDALDAEVASVPAKPSIMPDGVRVWLPAATVFADEHAEITPELIADLVASVNADSVSVPIDGGAIDSAVHESAQVRAVGWVHRAVVAMTNGSPQAYFEAEVKPSVAAPIDSGELAYTSIEAAYEIDDEGKYVPGSVKLISHGLTNTPRNREIQSIQTANRRVVQSYARARIAHGGLMSKKEEKPAETTPQTTQQAAPPPDAPAEPSVDELKKELEALRAENAALKAAAAQMSEQVSAGPSPKEVAYSLVDKAISEGRIRPADREVHAQFALVSPEGFTKLAASMPRMTKRITASEESPSAPPRASTEDANIIALRASLTASGLPKAAIDRQVAKIMKGAV